MKYSLRSLMRFSIRDLFWITVAVAILLAWWVEHRRQAAECEEHRIAYEHEVRKMEELVNSLGNDYSIELKLGTRGGITGVTQYGRRIPPIIRLRKPSAPAPNPSKR
jgi:hypothetical protein